MAEKANKLKLKEESKQKLKEKQILEAKAKKEKQIAETKAKAQQK